MQDINDIYHGLTKKERQAVTKYKNELIVCRSKEGVITFEIITHCFELAMIHFGHYA